MLLLHPGTQYLKRYGDGAFSNLLMREWESRWTGEYGWPRYTEYRHALLCHGPEFDNADRLRAAAAFAQPFIVVVGAPGEGDLPSRKAFVSATPSSAHLLALRQKKNNRLELRLEEV